MAQFTETEKLVRDTLAAKPFYRPEMGPVLVKILDKYCQSLTHKTTVCERAVEMKFGPEDRQEDRCPGPAELKELCEQVPAVTGYEAKRDCQFCAGAGYEMDEKRGGALRCRCGGTPMSFTPRAYEGPVSADPEMAELVSNIAGRKRL